MYKTKRYKTKRYKTKRYKTKRYKTKRYKKAKGIDEAKCGKIMECFRGNCGECMECFQLLNNEDNPNHIFDKQYKIHEHTEAPLTKPHLMKQKRFKLPKTVDAQIGKEIALRILEQES